MTIHRNCCAALGATALLALSGAPSNAAPAYVKSTVNLRSGPATANDIVGKIPSGSLVEANNCSDWCEVTWQGKTGYANKSAIDTSGRVPAARGVVRRGPGPAAYDGDEVVVGGPVYYGAPVVAYPYPYYRPYGYYRFRGYGYRYGGWRRRW